MMHEFPEQVMDHLYFSQNNVSHIRHENEIYEEMWEYFSKKYQVSSCQELHQHWSKSKVQLLEIYCSDSSQLTHQCEAAGLTAVRFGLKQGDLSTFGGRCKLYDVLWMCRPQHIWMSPRCGPWSSWNRLNQCKSLKLEAQIQSDRKGERVHLLLCDAMFRLQDWRGDSFHAHLEQPAGSEMMTQKELHNMVCHAFRVQCDMCTAGNLRHPNSHELLQKKTQIWTTSLIMWRMLQQYQCVGNHPHDTIAGSCHPKGSGRMSVTKYSELYTVLFSKRVSRAIQCSCHVNEIAFGDRSEFVGVASPSHSEMPEPKRRRLSGKFQPERLFVAPPESEARPSDNASDSQQNPMDQVRKLLHLAESCAPRVGKVVIQDGPLFEVYKKLFPTKR